MAKFTKKTRLAIVGASVRAAAQSALRAGFDVVGADLFADADLDGVCPITKIDNYPDGLADWLTKQEVDAWMYTGALENYPELVDRMAETAPLWGVSGEPLRRCRDVFLLADLCNTRKLRFPKTLPLHQAPLGEEGWLTRSNGPMPGSRLRRLLTRQDWRAAEPCVQRIEPGKPCAAIYSVGKQFAHLLGVTSQIISDGRGGVPEWSYLGSIGPQPISSSLREQLSALGILLKDDLELCGIIGIDFLADRDDLVVIEINPRFTASVELLEQEAESAVALHAFACQGKQTDPWEAACDRVLAKQIVYTQQDVTISQPFLDSLGWIKAADYPRLGDSIRAGQPVCTVFAEGIDEPSARTEVERIVDETLQRLPRTI